MKPEAVVSDRWVKIRSGAAPYALSPMSSLDGRVAVVTGGLGALGRQLCEALDDVGAEVVVADGDGLACRRWAEEQTWGAGRRLVGVGVDVTDPGSLAALRDEVLRRSGRIDVLVNVAARDEGSPPGPARAEPDTLEGWRRAIDVELTGTFLACHVLGAEMVARGGGSIVNVAPGSADSPGRAAARAGLVAFTRYLAARWASAGVRANVLSSGGVGPVLFLASDASSYVTGADLTVECGWTSG